MNKVIVKGITVTIMAVILSACSARVDHYTPSADNAVALRSIDKKINVSDITATTEVTSVMCRLANPVIMPNSEAINEYIENAFIDELKMANKFDENSKITLSGNLNNTTSSSGMTDGHWSFDMKVESSNGESFNVVHRHEYSGSFLGGVACRENMPDEFEPAVEELINAIVTDSRFTSLLN